MKRKPDPWYYVLNRGAAQLVPLDLAYRASEPIADTFHALWRKKRETARRNYALISGRPAGDPVVERMSRQCFREFGRYVVELLHVQGWGRDTIAERLTVEGEEHFNEAEAAGKGVIFVSAHMGSAEVAAAIAMKRGYRITSVAEELRPDLLWDWLRTCRAKMGVTLLPVNRSGIGLLRVLRKKEMVALVIDAGAYRGMGVPVTFFGRPTMFPDGPARLARLSGAPLVFGLAVRKPNGHFLASVAPPVYPGGKAKAAEDVRRMTQEIAVVFEEFVRRHPEQWYVFREIWPQADGRIQGDRE
ncbi:MAG TPA: lysophospholipid acyltransferase family protein [Dehalococcoidia bacterium]|nr:lysophospholipid acyltransferase family protein [Dehalococcoidia bacterium]